MRKKSTKKHTKNKSKRWYTSIILLAIFLLLGYGAWYVYCHYYPLINPPSTTNTDIVERKYQFGDVNNTHIKAAKKNGIRPVANRNQLQIKSLTKIVSCDNYKVDHLTHSVAYLTPASAKLLEDIGTRFKAVLKEKGFEEHRIIVTSILRTGDDVKRLRKTNNNASANSAHQYATTFDITYIRFDRQSISGKTVNTKQLSNILGKVLKELRNEGRCYIKYERKQHCFHITSRK